MPEVNGNKSLKDKLSSHLRELGIRVPGPPTPLGTCVESSATGSFVFLRGILLDAAVNHHPFSIIP